MSCRLVVAFVSLLLISLLAGSSTLKVDWISNRPYATSPSTSSLAVHFEGYNLRSDGGYVTSYEMWYRSLFDSQWNVIENYSGGGGVIGLDTYREEAQVLAIRVDEGKSLSSGTYTLSINRYGQVDVDLEHLETRSPKIPFGATAKELKAALDSIEYIKVREVVRCDGTISNGSIATGGFDGFWFDGCPYSSRGGYTYLIKFLQPKASRDFLPLLGVYRNELASDTWSGIGPQVLINHYRNGIVNPNLCDGLGRCSYVVDNLQEGTPYAFKVRASSSASSEWSAFSPASEFVSTLQASLPPRPRPPSLSTAGPHSISVRIVSIPAASDILSVECQYRPRASSPSARWFDAPSTALDDTLQTSYLVTVPSLLPSSQYEVRIRYVNHLGAGPYSNPSEPFETFSDEDEALTPLAPLIAEDAAGATYADVTLRASPDKLLDPRNSRFLGKQNIRLFYRERSEDNFHRVNDPVTFEPVKAGLEVHEVEAKSDDFGGAAACAGYFWLRMGSVDFTDMAETVSGAISFDATADEMKTALYSMRRISRANAKLVVRRRANQFNAYTWTIELHGMGDVPKLQLHKHLLYAVTSTDVYNVTVSSSSVLGYTSYFNTTTISDTLGRNASTVVTPAGTPVGDCFSSSPLTPIVTKTLKGYTNSAQEQAVTIRVHNLVPLKEYEVYAQYYDEHFAPGPRSASSFFTTVGDKGHSTDFINPLYAFNALPPRLQLEPRAAARLPNGPAVTVGGYYFMPAKLDDPHYVVPGIGEGGLSGLSGGNGYCVAILYNPRNQAPFETKYFHYRGSPQSFTIGSGSAEKGASALVTFKCWGGGGGGGKHSDLSHGLDSEYNDLRLLSFGGGAAFAQITVHVQPLDVLTIVVGAGGAGSLVEESSKGGYGGGGEGGRGLLGGSGGGGGGASIVYKRSLAMGASGSAVSGDGDELILVAAGGGGGGSTDVRVAYGGAGGAVVGHDGISSGGTEWPIGYDKQNNTILSANESRRYEYTAYACPTDADKGLFCLSVWDVVPASLPAEHQNLQYGHNPTANYSLWAEGGLGGGQDGGGQGGTSGSFAVRVSGAVEYSLYAGLKTIFATGRNLVPQARHGGYLSGGDGGEGKEGGGGGGGGFFGGGGGGSGLDAGGGGGGSSYISEDLARSTYENILTTIVQTPSLTFINTTHATFSLDVNWDRASWGPPYKYDIEVSLSAYAEDFTLFGAVDTNIPSPLEGLSSVLTEFTAANLLPDTLYRFRAVPVYKRGRGRATAALLLRTLEPSQNYWEPIVFRRTSLQSTGRGFANPVLQRPHLDTGVEVHAERISDNDERYSEAPSSEQYDSLPAARRGHTLSVVDEFVYMFGGRSNGYTCASVYKDFFNIGTPESGFEIYPCSHFQGETNELWSLNIHTYKWQFLNTSKFSSTPPPSREQHTTAVIGGHLYMFGGKSRIFTYDSAGALELTPHRDVVFGDLWRLNIEREEVLLFQWPSYEVVNRGDEGNLTVLEDRRMFVTIDTLNNATAYNYSDGISARKGLCISKVVVSVKVAHPCANQLRISLMGPGPQSGSANFHTHSSAHEIVLFNQKKSNGTAGCSSGTHSFVFDDDAGSRTDDVLSTDAFSGTFKPDGKLAEFIGGPPSAEWTLVLQDVKDDSMTGQLLQWDIQFLCAPCSRSYTWSNITQSGSVPSNRYQHKTITHGKYMFVYGGRDSLDSILTDLYRFDTSSRRWAELTPVDFAITLYTANSVGSSFVMTSYGLIRYGGYARQPYMTGGDNYNSDVFVQDPVTLRWRNVQVASWPGSDYSYGVARPPSRYLSSMIFVPSRNIKWKKHFSYRSLYDQYLRSTKTNYANANADTLMLFGGFDGATGSSYDGSNGGLLNDMWSLRLANFSTSGNRHAANTYVSDNCKWRSSTTAASQGRLDCLSSTSMASCEYRDLMMLIWCDFQNQTIS